MVQYTCSSGTTARVPLTLVVVVAVVGVCTALALMPAAAPADAADTDDFVTVWRVNASDLAITIPVDGSTGSYDVDWGDGSTNSSVTGDISHTYDGAGDYTVRISGDFTRIKLGGDPANAEQLRSIEQWGDIRWSSMEGAFMNATNMGYNATDSPDLSGVTDMSRMFHLAHNFNGDISGWNTAGVTDMSGMFTAAALFNGDISGWDVSDVTDMSDMFRSAFTFNGDLSRWDTSSVTNMSGMFYHAFTFNGNVSVWDTSSVTDMRNMFWSARTFNGDISEWNTSGVTDMSGMFGDTNTFDSDISGWDVSKVTDMTNMFYQASSFSQNLGPWYITLNDTSVGGNDSYVAAITAQNTELREHSPTYGLAGADAYPDNANFTISGGVLSLNEGAPARDSYVVGINATGSLFGQNNTRAFEIDGQSNSPPPISTPTLTPLPSNSQPVADAGVNQTVSAGATVQLNGSSSSDPDGSVVSYSWTAPAGITLDNATAADPSFTAPTVESDTDYMFTLTVTDDDGATATTTVSVTVQGSAHPSSADSNPTTVSTFGLPTTFQEPPSEARKVCR